MSMFEDLTGKDLELIQMAETASYLHDPEEPSLESDSDLDVEPTDLADDFDAAADPEVVELMDESEDDKEKHVFIKNVSKKLTHPVDIATEWLKHQDPKIQEKVLRYLQWWNKADDRMLARTKCIVGVIQELKFGFTCSTQVPTDLQCYTYHNLNIVTAEYMQPLMWWFKLYSYNVRSINKNKRKLAYHLWNRLRDVFDGTMKCDPFFYYDTRTENYYDKLALCVDEYRDDDMSESDDSRLVEEEEQSVVW